MAYRIALGGLGLRTPVRGQSQSKAAEASFLVLIPSRNEERVIGQTVAHLRALDYPAEKVRIIVVADDCLDGTAEAAANAGAFVLAKPGPASGKGATIQWAMNNPFVQESAWTALLVLDADSRPRPDFLSVMDAALIGGGEALQARTESLKPEGWVARGYALNTTQRNRLWHQARERAGFSAALTGTGVCLKRSLLTRLPMAPKTLTEDLEYAAVLTRAGVRVRFLFDAVLDIEQPHSLGSSVFQRLRWARGQLMTAIHEGPPLLVRAVRARDLAALDTAFYLVMPSLVPLQSLLLGWVVVSLLVDTASLRAFPGAGTFPLSVLIAVLVASLLLPCAALVAERRRMDLRDWLAFLGLMGSWMPIAIYGALTFFVRSWRPTPHGVHVRPNAAAPVEPLDQLPSYSTRIESRP